jgi:hypothetical protein
MKIPIASGKVTKKEIKQMNAQARIISQGLNSSSIDVVGASNFLDQLNKDVITGDERDRSKDKAIDRINIYLDRIHIIFENAYHKPTNIESQLKNAYVSPKIKIQIYDNTKNYYDKLKAILDNVNDKILTMKMKLADDDNEIISECENSVGSLSNILTKYQEKKDEWPMQNEPIPMGRVPQSSATAGREKAKKKIALEKQKNANAMERADAERQLAIREANDKRIAEGKRRNEEKRQKAAKMRAEAKKQEEAKRLELERLELERQQIEERDARDARADKRRKLLGGGAGKTRKLKRRPRKTIKRGGKRKRTIKRRPKSRKNTRRRR